MERAKLAGAKKNERPKPSISDCAGTRSSARRRKRSSYAATAALTTWLRASSSDVIGGAESVSASGTVRRRGRTRRRARSSAKRRDRGSGAQTLGPFPSLHVPVRRPRKLPENSKRLQFHPLSEKLNRSE
jgi:hypothetical protein